jgi:hypothetical protein
MELLPMRYVEQKQRPEKICNVRGLLMLLTPLVIITICSCSRSAPDNPVRLIVDSVLAFDNPYIIRYYFQNEEERKDKSTILQP